MKLLGKLSLFAIALLCVQCKSNAPQFDSGLPEAPDALEGTASTSASASYDDWARFLAGLPGDRQSAFTAARGTAAWKQHQAEMDKMFSYFASTRQGPIRGWQGGALGGLGARCVFYPFGGPDYLFSQAMFPGASTHILVGLEGASALPSPSAVTGGNLAGTLGNLRTSINSVVRFSYFITKNMRGELSATSLQGTLPPILVFLARTGHRIQSVEMISLTSDGRIAPRGAGSAPGFRIIASGKEVCYIQEDLSNGSLGSDQRLLRFVSAHGQPVTFLKSASYLMHQDGFSVIRNAILNQSKAVVTDPSGVPFRSFDPALWNITLYGKFASPLAMFASYSQPELAAAYSQGHYSVKPLPFGVGYNQTSLIVARKSGR